MPSFVGNAMWNWRMLGITGQAHFADILELVLYNSVLAGISLDGNKFFYTNTLRQVNDLPYELRWSRQRESYISCFCCPPNVVRTIAEVGSYAYSISDEGIWITLYGSNTLETQLTDGSHLKLTQETDYPWGGSIKITISSPEEKRFSVMLRIPCWTKGATLNINTKLENGDTKHSVRTTPGLAVRRVNLTVCRMKVIIRFIFTATFISLRLASTS